MCLAGAVFTEMAMQGGSQAIKTPTALTPSTKSPAAPKPVEAIGQGRWEIHMENLPTGGRCPHFSWNLCMWDPQLIEQEGNSGVPNPMLLFDPQGNQVPKRGVAMLPIKCRD